MTGRWIRAWTYHDKQQQDQVAECKPCSVIKKNHLCYQPCLQDKSETAHQNTMKKINSDPTKTGTAPSPECRWGVLNTWTNGFQINCLSLPLDNRRSLKKYFRKDALLISVLRSDDSYAGWACSSLRNGTVVWQNPCFYSYEWAVKFQ